jgi:hypothetical protein
MWAFLAAARNQEEQGKLSQFTPSMRAPANITPVLHVLCLFTEVSQLDVPGLAPTDKLADAE